MKKRIKKTKTAVDGDSLKASIKLLDMIKLASEGELITHEFLKGKDFEYDSDAPLPYLQRIIAAVALGVKSKQKSEDIQAKLIGWCIRAAFLYGRYVAQKEIEHGDQGKPVNYDPLGIFKDGNE